jgi:hypothetical protein
MSTSKRAQFASKINARVRRKSTVGAGAAFNCLLFVQGVGLTVACATGEQLDASPVAPIALVDASVSPHDASMGSGGGEVIGSGGAVTGSGGAPRGSGGTSTGGAQGKGGGAGGSPGTGGAPGTGGKVGAGGTIATGGASSGGSGNGGALASGGKSSGGASAGGSAGAGGGGGGSGGAQNCPGYVDDDACSKCICQKCKTQVEACVNSGDATKDQQCKAIQDCAETNHCAGSPCYCNQATNPFCAPPDGPCVDPIEAVAGKGANPLTVQNLGNDSTNPIGRANNIGKCSTSNCKSECGL